MNVLPRLARVLALWVMAGRASAQVPTVTIQSNMDVGEYVVQANGGSVTQDSITGAITGTTGVAGTGAKPILFGSLLCRGKVGDRFQPQFSGTAPTTFALTGVSTGATISVTTSGIQSSVKELGVTATFATGGTVIHEGGTISGLTPALLDDTYTGSFPPLVIADTTNGQICATFQFTVTIHIRTGITLTKVEDLAFGQVVALGSAGTVAVTPYGTAYAGGASRGPTAGAIASFIATGGKNANYQITFSGSAIPGQGSVTLTSGANTMTATLQSYVSSSAAAQGTLSAAAGAQTFQVGGSLAVGAAQAEGAYSGIFTVAITYN